MKNPIILPQQYAATDWQNIPDHIIDMMKERGYEGPIPATLQDAMQWTLQRYNIWINIYPMYLEVESKNYEPLFDYKKVLVWTGDARDITRRMAGDGDCPWWSIHHRHESSPKLYQHIEEADIYCLYGGQYWGEAVYKRIDECVFGTLIRIMLWDDEWKK